MTPTWSGDPSGRRILTDAIDEPVTALPFPAWARMTDERRAHAARVATLMAEWAAAMGVSDQEAHRWERAALLHDAVKDADEAWLASHAADVWGVPALLHGPVAAQLASAAGESDAGVLMAVRYHSVGWQGWDAVGRMLYLADALEPGRKLDAVQTRAAERVPRDADGVLRQVAASRVGHLLRTGRRLLPETVDFWNALQ